MFAVKIFNQKDNRTGKFKKTTNNIMEYITGRLNQQAKLISDDDCIEIVSGSNNISPEENNNIVAELTIRKTVVINNAEFNDKDKLDRYITEIKHFCEQAKNIEEVKYLHPTLRTIEKAENQDSNQPLKSAKRD